jgi:hypothetical protein
MRNLHSKFIVGDRTLFIQGTGFNNKRKAISTVLGLILFVSVLTSAVVPMFMTMNQADTLYDQTLQEWETLDEEKIRENEVVFYAYPSSVGANELEIELDNQCEMEVTTTRIWVNTTYYNVSVSVPAMSKEVIGTVPTNVKPGLNSSYRVHLTTTRGNTFESSSGIVFWDGSDWYAQQLGIFVQISGGGFLGFGAYRVTVSNVTNTNVDYNVVRETNFASGTASLFFDVTAAGAGKYKVVVEKRNWWTWSYMDEKKVTIEWPSGPAIEWVYFE